MKKFFKKIVNENPVLVLTLGMCPTLAITTKLENALVMGMAVTIVLILSNFIISIVSKYIDNKVRIPCFIIIIAGLVTILEILMNTYLPTMYKILGIYIPLIVVNCIILGRAESYASKNKPISSIIDGLAIGLGFTLAISIISVIREIIGSGTLTIFDSTSKLIGYKAIYNIFDYPIKVFTTPAGAFLTLAIIIAIINKIKSKKEVVK
ncbi:MAG: electron transport complex subunit RsxE [Bacilli bacterium]